MAADQRLLNAIRRFMSPGEVEIAYKAIWCAYAERLDDVTVIISKQTEGESAGAQVVVNKEDYLEMMEVMEDRLQEIAAENAGTAGSAGAPSMDFSQRYIET